LPIFLDHKECVVLLPATTQLLSGAAVPDLELPNSLDIHRIKKIYTPPNISTSNIQSL